MDREAFIRLANVSGAAFKDEGDSLFLCRVGFFNMDDLCEFAAAVAAATKEETAAMFDDSPNAEMFRQDIADQIRASIKGGE